jgi:hypothetical protein
MTATVLQIKRKLRPYRGFGLLASLRDFVYTIGEPVEPRVVVENPNISLYCLDDRTRQAIFVETPGEVDLVREPFLFEAQYQQALRLIALPYEVLHTLARDLREVSENLIFIYSVGRCGSTLVSKAFNETGQVLSLSEPDVFTQIVELREPDGSRDEELSGILLSSTRVLCAWAAHRGRSACAIKFRSFCIETADLMCGLFPEAKRVFLYRNAESWVKSAVRAFRITEPRNVAIMRQAQADMARLLPVERAYPIKPASELSVTEYLTVCWLSVLQRYLWLDRKGIRMCALRYEDLIAEPERMLGELFAYCGLPLGLADVACNAFGKDSQAGSGLSRQSIEQGLSVHLDERRIPEIRKVLANDPIIGTPDFIVPGTLFPSSPVWKRSRRSSEI